MSTTQNFACLSRLEKKEKLLNIYKEDKHKKKKKRTVKIEIHHCLQYILDRS